MNPVGASEAIIAAVVIITLPALIIGVGELEERLRQRDSAYQGVVSIVRIWVVPLVAVWVLSRTLFDIDDDNPFLLLLDSAALIATAIAVLAALRILVAGLIDRPRTTGRRPVPRLVLAMPRLVVLLVTAWLLIAGIWGVDLSSLLTALGVTSLVISFALQDTLGGIASGFTLLADQPFAAGDWIESDDVEGRVIDVNWRSTRIQDRNGDLVVVPNSALSKATIINFDQPTRFHRVSVLVQVERTATPTAAKAMFVDAALSTPGVLADPAPFAFVTNIADPVVDYMAYMWVDDYSIVPQVRADFSALVWYLSYRHDVPLPNPAQDLYVFDGAATALERNVSPAVVRRALLESPLLAELDDALLDKLASTSTIDAYQEGETIVSNNRHSDLFVLEGGRASMVLRAEDGSDLHVLDIGLHEIFGAINDLPDTDRAGLVVAATDCRVVRMRGPEAGAAIAASSGLGAAIEELAVSRRRRCDRALRRAARSLESAPEPVAPTSGAGSASHVAGEDDPT